MSPLSEYESRGGGAEDDDDHPHQHVAAGAVHGAEAGGKGDGAEAGAKGDGAQAGEKTPEAKKAVDQASADVDKAAKLTNADDPKAEGTKDWKVGDR